MITKKQAVINYTISVLLFISSIVLFAIILIFGLMDINDMEQYLVPGTYDIQLEENVTYTIFHEYRSVIDGVVISPMDGPDTTLQIVVLSPTGDTVPLKSRIGSSSYNFGDRSGRDICSILSDITGEFTLQTDLGNSCPEQTVITIAKDFTSKLMLTVMGSMIVLCVLMSVSFVIAIITIIMQITSKEHQLKQNVDPLKLEKYLKLIAIFNYVLGIQTILISLVLILHLSIGIAMILNPDFFGDDFIFMGYSITLLSLLIILLGITLGIVQICSGRRLSKRCSYKFSFIVAVIQCLNIPIGTVIGVFTITLFKNDQVKKLYHIESKEATDES